VYKYEAIEGGKTKIKLPVKNFDDPFMGAFPAWSVSGNFDETSQMYSDFFSVTFSAKDNYILVSPFLIDRDYEVVIDGAVDAYGTPAPFEFSLTIRLVDDPRGLLEKHERLKAGWERKY